MCKAQHGRNHGDFCINKQAEKAGITGRARNAKEGRGHDKIWNLNKSSWKISALL